MPKNNHVSKSGMTLDGLEKATEQRFKDHERWVKAQIKRVDSVAKTNDETQRREIKLAFESSNEANAKADRAFTERIEIHNGYKDDLDSYTQTLATKADTALLMERIRTLENQGMTREDIESRISRLDERSTERANTNGAKIETMSKSYERSEGRLTGLEKAHSESHSMVVSVIALAIALLSAVGSVVSHFLK